MDEDTPAWLTPSGGGSPPPAAAPASAPPPVPTTLSTNVGGGGGVAMGVGDGVGDAALPPRDETDLPRMILLMRVLNMLSVAALVAVSILEMIYMPTPDVWILAIYATIGGTLVCCLETQLKFLRVPIAMNFGFLFSPFWRFFFYVLLASVAYSYERIWSYAVAGSLVFTALFNTYVLCRYPSYNKARELIAEEEDRKIEAKIQGEVRKAALNQLARP